MTRYVKTLMASVFVAITLAPVQLTVMSDGGLAIGRTSAFAAAPPPPAPPKQTSLVPVKCVPVSVPILGTAANDKCVPNDPNNGGAIIVYLAAILKLVSGAVGTVIVLMLVIAGIQYITSAGQPEMIKGAKKRIVDAMTALVLFLMMFAILNFLVPGGVL